MVEVLGNLCNAIGGYIVNVATSVGNVVSALIGK